MLENNYFDRKIRLVLQVYCLYKKIFTWNVTKVWLWLEKIYSFCIRILRFLNHKQNWSQSHESDGFVEQGGHILLSVSMSGTEHLDNLHLLASSEISTNHDSILDRECIEMIDHDMIWFWQHIGITLNRGVFVENDLNCKFISNIF